MSNSKMDWRRGLYALNAVVACFTVGLGFSLMTIGFYVNKVDVTQPTLIGNNPAGVDQVWERFFDWLTYFTNISNIVVAVVMIALLRRPEWFVGEDLRARIWQALRLDSVLMITVTGVVYNVLLATGGKTGVDALSNAMLHVIDPILTVVVFLVAGPRGLLRPRTVLDALVIPILWAAWALVRGSFIGAYPYSFFDVTAHGYGFVIGFVGQILVFALVISSVLFGYDRLVSRVKA